MNVTTQKGDTVLSSKEEIKKLMEAGKTQPDEIWLSGEEEYPCLVIMIYGDYVYLNYFEDEGDCLQPCSESDEEVTFKIGDKEFMPDVVVSFETAVACMEEFYDTGECPECIEWEEL